MNYDMRVHFRSVQFSKRVAILGGSTEGESESLPQMKEGGGPSERDMRGLTSMAWDDKYAR